MDFAYIFFAVLFVICGFIFFLTYRFWKYMRYFWIICGIWTLYWGILPYRFQRQYIKITIPPIFEVIEETQFNTPGGFCTFAEYRVRQIGTLDDLPPSYLDRTEALRRAKDEDNTNVNDIPEGTRFYVKNASWREVFSHTNAKHIITEYCRGAQLEEDRRRRELSRKKAIIFGGSSYRSERWIYDPSTGLLTYYGPYRRKYQGAPTK